jgi:hypothetical protein
MYLSLFILALWVLLDSFNRLAWFAIDNRLIGFVGIAFVVAVIIEAYGLFRGRPLLNWRGRNPQA